MALSLKELREQYQDRVDEGNAILALADQSQGGEMTKDQKERFDELMAEETGEIALLKGQIEAKEAIDRKKESLRAHADAVQGMRNPVTLQERTETQKGGMPRVVSRSHSLVAFKGEDADKNAWLSGQWLRAIAAQSTGRRDDEALQRLTRAGLSVSAQHVIGDDTKGGYVVPKPLSDAIINYRERSGVCRATARVMAMTANSLDVPKKVGTLTVDYPGEATAITASEQTWGQVNLVAVKRAILSKVSQELNDDAIINVMDDLAQEMGSDLAIHEDDCYINGDGTGGYGSVTGLIPALHANGTHTLGAGDTTWSAIDFPAIHTMMGLLPVKHHTEETAFMCSPAFYDTVLLALMTAAGGNYIGSLRMGNVGANTNYGRVVEFMGYPCFLTNKMPNATAVGAVACLFGNFRRAAILGDRIGVRVAVSPDFAFDEDVLTIRATTRYDIQVHEPGNGGAGAYVGLATAAA